MSFEGYYEYIAEDGTYWCEDVYEASLSPVSPETGSPAKWVHLVDETNGVNKDDPDSYPAPKIEITYIMEELCFKYAIHYKPYGDFWKLFKPINDF